jgi:hypothetical protein
MPPSEDFLLLGANYSFRINLAGLVSWPRELQQRGYVLHLDVSPRRREVCFERAECL